MELVEEGTIQGDSSNASGGIRRKPSRRPDRRPNSRWARFKRWLGFQNKTLWDLLQLLVVPIALSILGIWFTARQEANQLEIENQRSQDAAVQAYLDQMSQSLTGNDNLLDSQPGSNARAVSRARTLTVLGTLDASHKTSIMRFLYEAHLIDRENSRRDDEDREDPVVSLTGANLFESSYPYLDLSYADLSGVNLARMELAPTLNGADLSDAQLADSELQGAQLEDAILSDAGLLRAQMQGARLVDAHLDGAVLSGADLSGSYLMDADLSGAIMNDTNLEGANLKNADLTDATVTQQQLDSCFSLEGVTMPNGKKHE